jgi:hypothetical protein
MSILSKKLSIPSHFGQSSEQETFKVDEKFGFGGVGEQSIWN